MVKFESTIQLYLAHLDSIIKTYVEAVDEDGNISELEGIRIITRSLNLVQKITEKDSPYLQEIDSAYRGYSNTSYKVEIIIGILLGLKDELEIGTFDSVPEIIRGELFVNFLEMAEYLNSEGYKDAAAVIAGSSLETHLRRLAQKNDIEIEIEGTGVKPRYKKAEAINQELYKAKVYSPFDQKQITAWLDLRNNAAHGDYSSYSGDQVMRMIEWAEDFISKNRA